MDEQAYRESRRRNEAGEGRRELARDVVVGGFMAAIAVTVAWGMWRLDDRSERLFAIVAAERAASSSCP